MDITTRFLHPELIFMDLSNDDVDTALLEELDPVEDIDELELLEELPMECVAELSDEEEIVETEDWTLSPAILKGWTDA